MAVDGAGRASIMRRGCFLEAFDTRKRPCQGRMDRAHLVTRQVLRREGHEALIPDERTWVPACRLHHSSWDSFMGVVVPRAALPAAFVALMQEIGLSWWVERRYGPENGS